jgi:hypothetical protein
MRWLALGTNGSVGVGGCAVASSKKSQGEQFSTPAYFGSSSATRRLYPVS